MHADGTEERRLTNNDVYDAWPDWANPARAPSSPPAAAATKAARPRGEVILREDFSDASRSWYAGSPDGVSQRISGGVYTFRILRKGAGSEGVQPLEPPAQSVSVEASARLGRADRAAGILVSCYADEANGYGFLVNPQNGALALIGLHRGRYRPLAMDAVPAGVLHVPGTNRMRIDCLGANAGRRGQARLFVNDRLVGKVRDRRGFARFRYASVGVAGQAAGERASFDDVVVRKLR